MKDRKVWLVLGAAEGLGPAAVKYLRANQQIVVAADTNTTSHLRLDFIINNSNYDLFSTSNPDIAGSIETTMASLSTLVPYLRQQPQGSIINIPPQLCLSTLSDETKPKFLQDMNLFLTTLRRELETFDCILHFLEPGERFVQF